MKSSLLLLGITLSVLLVSGCTTDDNGNSGDMIIVSGGTIIDPQVCMQKGIADKVVVYHSPTCPACQQALPVLEELEDEVSMEFIFIDLSTERDKAEELGIMPTHIPTTLIKCKAYTGYKEKDTFRSLMEGE